MLGIGYCESFLVEYGILVFFPHFSFFLLLVFTLRKFSRTQESPFSTCYFSRLHGVRTAFLWAKFSHNMGSGASSPDSSPRGLNEELPLRPGSRPCCELRVTCPSACSVRGGSALPSAHFVPHTSSSGSEQCLLPPCSSVLRTLPSRLVFSLGFVDLRSELRAWC